MLAATSPLDLRDRLQLYNTMMRGKVEMVDCSF